MRMAIRLDVGSLSQASITWLTITGTSRKGAQVLSKNHPAMKSQGTRRGLSILKPTCGMRRYGWRPRLVRAKSRISMLRTRRALTEKEGIADQLRLLRTFGT